MKVLVCGTNYGATYIRALATQPQNLSLAAILSTGSQRSKQYAAQLQVPHFTQIEQIPAGTVDIACIAVAGEGGQQLAVQCLNRGIHVLCEHPVGEEVVRYALELATKNGCRFHVNAHFADLGAPQAFYQAIATASQQAPCMHFDLNVNLRTLYSGLDLLGRALGSLSNIGLVPATQIDKTKGLFETLQLTGPEFSVSLLCQNFASQHDDGSATLLNHRVSATFPHGNLLLCETAGPVFWFPSPVSMSAETWQSYLPVQVEPSNQYQLMQQRDIANISALNKLVTSISEPNAIIEQQPDYLIGLAKLWEQTLAVLQRE
ncbi:Siderophore-like synthase protein, putative [Shewanella piezotolerans WP3]|uniref:Siderophore-like synthase protein, putative n=1 Tax=Shewanella piezotolerans (strain WP3 / JCM 13877) TaxID=225849 RepID=B8CN33_SHEPW|nr:Gfo/Idh/MocA family oxidoreductase [Shewanella piezotolerans]ACJ28535.1 Siderophore-like synthase protein, putative [Shewanella piezotolerans WP3]